MLLPVATLIAQQLTEEQVASAQPDAPVMPTGSVRTPRPRFDAVRRATASGLRRLADRLEPRRDTCQPAV
jgi:hypothetical protein